LFIEYEGIDGGLNYSSDHETLLHAACRSGYSAMAAALLENGADVQGVDRDGKTAFHIACHNLQFNCLRLLGEHLNHLNADRDTVLNILCGMDISILPEFVKFIRETKGLDINKSNIQGETPLHIACKCSSGDVVEALVAMKCDVNACDGIGNTALHIAVCSELDRLKKVSWILESGKCNSNVPNKREHTPLHGACEGENIEVLEMLVTDQRCDVNIQDDNGNTPLHTAIHAHSGLRWRKVQLLLNNSACGLNLMDKEGSTPLHVASERNDTSIVELLVADKRKCNVNIQDINGDTALHRGVHSAEIVKLLIKKCHVNHDLHNRKGQTPFHKAIATGVLASVEAFLINGVDIQQSDIYKDAPIHIACQYSRFNMQFWATKHVILTNRMLMEIQHFIL
jgi:ankyrin repeat protein